MASRNEIEVANKIYTPDDLKTKPGTEDIYIRCTVVWRMVEDLWGRVSPCFRDPYFCNEHEYDGPTESESKTVFMPILNWMDSEDMTGETNEVTNSKNLEFIAAYMQESPRLRHELPDKIYRDHSDYKQILCIKSAVVERKIKF